jgi:hypothetical protein
MGSRYGNKARGAEKGLLPLRGPDSRPLPLWDPPIPTPSHLSLFESPQRPFCRSGAQTTHSTT